MYIRIEFGSYNRQRYSRPWIAKVTAWPVGKHPTLEWGGNIDAWAVEIEAEPGQIIRWGQKDNRGNGTESRWGIVNVDGSYTETDAVTCRDHWRKGCPVPVSKAETEDNVIPFKSA